MGLDVGEERDPMELDLLGVGRALPFVSVEMLPLVARTLGAAGCVVVVACDEGAEHLAFRGVPRLLPCARAGARDNEEDEGGDWRGGGRAERSGDRPVAYESELSERRSRGSVPLTSGAWWTGLLAVPVEGGEPLAYFQLERHVAGDDSGADEGVGAVEHSDFVVPASEVDAVLLLLHGVVAQARRDGVLPLVPVSGGDSSSPTGDSPG